MLLCGTNDEKLKIELLSQWKLEAEFRNLLSINILPGDWQRGQSSDKFCCHQYPGKNHIRWLMVSVSIFSHISFKKWKDELEKLKSGGQQSKASS